MDILGLTSKAYRFLIEERQYLARIALVPAVVKLICGAAVAALGYDMNFIRQALIMLPSYFLDGWLVAHVARFALFGQRWPFRETAGTDRSKGVIHVIRDRAVGVMAGTVMYVTVSFLGMGCFAALYLYGWLPRAVTPDATKDMRGIATLFAVTLLLQGTRQLFFIVASANVGLRRFFRQPLRLLAVVPLMLLWLTCALPVVFLLVFVVTLVAAPMAGPEGFNQAGPAFLLITCWALIDTIVDILASFAAAQGLKPYLAKSLRA